MPDGVESQVLGDGVADPSTTRGMGLVPVNPPKVTSVVGHSPDYDNEFVITRLTIRDGKTSDDQRSDDHRGNNTTGNRGKGD